MNNNLHQNSVNRSDTQLSYRSDNQVLKLATIYIKPQVYNGINSFSDALKQGTAFNELYSPFEGRGGVR